MTTDSAQPKLTILEECAEFFLYLPHFLKNPKKAVCDLPHWGLGGVIVYQIGFSLLAGIICGILTHSLAGLLLNTLFFPIQALLMGWLITVTIELGFRWWAHKRLDLKKLFVLVLMCQIPFVLIRILSAFDLPIDFLGLGAMAYLLYVSVPHHFDVTTFECRRVVGTFFGLLLVVWAITVAAHLKDELRFQKAVHTAQSQLFPPTVVDQVGWFLIEKILR